MNIIILTEQQINDLSNYIDANDVLAYDTETTGLNVRSAQVIGFSVCGLDESSFYLPLLSWNGGELVPVMSMESAKLILQKLATKKLLMHNASFDVRVTKNYFGIDLVNAVYCDTMLLKHTVDEERPFALKEIAKKIQSEIGIELDEVANQEQLDMIDSIKENGGEATKENYQLYKADMTKIGTYANKDTILTVKIYKYYSDKLTQQGLEDFFYNKEVMPLYKNVTIPMEERGIVIDLELLNQSKVEIEQDILSLEDSIQSAIAPLLTTHFIPWFLWNFLPPKRTGQFAQALVELRQLPLPKNKSGSYKLDAKSIAALEDSIYKKFLANDDQLLDMSEVVEIQNYAWQSTGERYMFNLNSKHHLKKLFFDTLEENPVNSTDKGNPQVDNLFLSIMAQKYNWVRDLVAYNKLIKIKGTYIDRFLEAQENGIFYPSFLQHRTTSGRYGSDIQQLNRPYEQGQLDSGEVNPLVFKHNNRIRSFFIAGEGCKLVGADFASLEVVVFADDAGDKALLDMIRNKEDFYSSVAISVFPHAAAYSADKNSPQFLKKHLPKLRQDTKSFALGIRYGLEDFKLSKDLKIGQSEAKKIIEQYFKSYPNLKRRMDSLREQAIKYGIIKSKGGRIRHLPEIVSITAEHGTKILDSLWLWKQYNETPKKYAAMKEVRKRLSNLINNSLNFPIQSMAASIVNQSAIRIANEFKRRNMKAYICMNVHDELVIRCPDSEASDAAKIMKYYMENTIKLAAPLEAIPNTGDRYSDIK